MTNSKQTEIIEIKEMLKETNEKFNNYINRLEEENNPLVLDAYTAYVVDKMKKNPIQMFNDLTNELQGLVNSLEIYDNLLKYYELKHNHNFPVEALCSLIKELSDEEILPKETFDVDKIELNNVSLQLSKKGITPLWLASHGLVSKFEVQKIQQNGDTSDIVYKKLKNGIRIDSVNSKGGIIIPDYIDGLPVIKIGERAFYKRKDITSVVLPRYLTEIERCAFLESSIVTLVIPDSVEKIGDHAFCDCKKLMKIKLPKELKTIKYQTFYGCSSLTKIKIPDKVKIIYSHAFVGCKKLKQVQIPDSVVKFDSWIFDSKTILYCNANSKATNHASHWRNLECKPFELYIDD